MFRTATHLVNGVAVVAALLFAAPALASTAYSKVFTVDLRTDCSLTYDASVPTTGTKGQPVWFRATGTTSMCNGTPSYTWLFGDGTSATGANVVKTYDWNFSYSWLLTASVDGKTYTKSGTITIGQTGPATSPPVLFAHGICSDGSTWNPMLDSLEGFNPGVFYLPPQARAQVHVYYDRLKNQVLRRIDASPDIPYSPYYVIHYHSGLAGQDGFDKTRINDVPIQVLAYQLKMVVEKIRSVTQAQKVDIVGHSMGGLVSRAYVEGLAEDTSGDASFVPGSIRHIVTFDTPHGGFPSTFDNRSPEAAEDLLCPLELTSTQQTQMLPGSEFLEGETPGSDGKPRGLNRRPLPASVNFTSVVSVGASTAAGDGVVSTSSQNLRDRELYECESNVDVRLQELNPLAGFPPVAHMLAHQTDWAAKTANGILSSDPIPGSACVALGDVAYVFHPTVPPTGVAYRIVIDFPEILTKGPFTNCAGVATVVVRSASGTELSRHNVDTSGIQYVDIGEPPPGWYADLVSTCPTTASMSVETWELNKAPCVVGRDTLCLNNGRFEVKSNWKDFVGNTGKGQAEALTSDTGYFWFFDDANVELVLKVLDGRVINGRFWVFYGALSNVQYSIFVRDTQTGETISYFNPENEFASRGDTDAFAPGKGSSFELVEWRDPDTATTSFEEIFGLVSVPSAATSVSSSVTAASACQVDDQTLCLHNSRFQVRVTWKDFTGNTGVGHAKQATADTGYFWFFDDTNVELIVKALDGRGVNGRYWVFYGALSNVEYSMTVTDTVTGAVKVYNNPLHAFGSVGDTTAFQGVDPPCNGVPVSQGVHMSYSSLGGRTFRFEARDYSPFYTFQDCDRFHWSFGDGGTGEGPSSEHTFVSDGAYEVTLTVTNSNGSTVEGPRRVEVFNR